MKNQICVSVQVHPLTAMVIAGALSLVGLTGCGEEAQPTSTSEPATVTTPEPEPAAEEAEEAEATAAAEGEETAEEDPLVPVDFEDPAMEEVTAENLEAEDLEAELGDQPLVTDEDDEEDSAG